MNEGRVREADRIKSLSPNLRGLRPGGVSPPCLGNRLFGDHTQSLQIFQQPGDILTQSLEVSMENRRFSASYSMGRTIEESTSIAAPR